MSFPSSFDLFYFVSLIGLPLLLLHFLSKHKNMKMRRLQKTSWWLIQGSPFFYSYLSNPSLIPIHPLIQPFKATCWLSTHYISNQPILVIHHSVNQYLLMSVLNLKFSSLYPLLYVLSSQLISITWSMFPLLIPLTHL